MAYNGPGEAQHRLLVNDLDIAPDQEVKQVLVLAQLTPIDEAPAGFGLDDGLGECAHRLPFSTFVAFWFRGVSSLRPYLPAKRRGRNKGYTKERGGGSGSSCHR